MVNKCFFTPFTLSITWDKIEIKAFLNIFQYFKCQFCRDLLKSVKKKVADKEKKQEKLRKVFSDLRTLLIRNTNRGVKFKRVDNIQLSLLSLFN